MGWLAAAIGAILLSLLASEVNGWTWHLAVWITRRGASRMSADIGDEYEEIYVGELDAMRDRPLSALVVAFRMFRDSRITASLVRGTSEESSTLLRRIADFTLASVMLVMLAPLMIAVAVAIRFTMGSPIMFRQERVGRGRARFAIAKFRTMVVSDSGNPMVPPIGRWLRWLNLDELPVLWSVVKGDMALVGPRAQLPEVADMRSGDERLEVRPGLAEEWPFDAVGFNLIKPLYWNDDQRRWVLLVAIAFLALLGSLVLFGAR